MILLDPHAQLSIGGILAHRTRNSNSHQPLEEPFQLAKVRGGTQEFHLVLMLYVYRNRRSQRVQRANFEVTLETPLLLAPACCKGLEQIRLPGAAVSGRARGTAAEAAGV